MRCPKCGFEQTDGAIECGKCGVIIAKALKAQQSPAAPRPAPTARQAPPPAPSLPKSSNDKKNMSLTAIVSLLVVATVVFWWINFPLANKIPEGAYVNMKHQFALSAPRDWLQLTPENAKRIFEENKDRFTGSFGDSIRDSVSKPGVEVGFIKMPDTATEFSPSINVVVVPLQMPPLSESEKDKAADVLVKEMRKGLAGYAKESASLIKVDGLLSLEIVGTVPFTFVSQKSEPIMGVGAYGRQQVVGYKPEVKKKFTMKLRQLFVPGKKRSYLITYTGEAASFAEVAPIFDSITESFRVLQRPPRFGRITRLTLDGGLFGLTLALTYLFIRRTYGRFSRS
jgi:hypothetical protein